MADVEIGGIEWLELRAVWRNESADFTPWLLRHVDVLRDALGGLDLELERAEHPVGVFSLDLVGSDLTHRCRLVVENQIEASDHGHLGQLLTYAAGERCRHDRLDREGIPRGAPGRARMAERAHR